MTVELWTIVFVVGVLVRLGVELWLTQRHVAHVERYKSAVPIPFTEDVSLEAHQKAADYTVVKAHFGMVTDVLSTLVLLAVTVGGGIAWLNAAWRGSFAGVSLGVAVIMSFLLASAILSSFAGAYRTFVIEERFGFNRSTPATFVADLIKQLGLVLVLATPLVWVVLWLMNAAGRGWWIYTWFVWMAFTLTLTWAYPRIIAPWFNTFLPLEDVSLRERIEGLLKKCGFASQGVFVMDGSRRSSHGNAYFTGLGNNKRIVFFDTLLSQLAPAEIEAVLAHELGHFRLRHVRKRLGLTALLSFAGLFVLGQLAEAPEFQLGLGINRPALHNALLLFLLAAPVLTFFFHPLISALSRKHEYEADDYAAKHAPREDLVQALTKLYADTAKTLTPDPIHSLFYDSHPPPLLRIKHIQGGREPYRQRIDK